MPEVVLRNPALPRQPIVVPVAPGDKLDGWLRRAGWDIDTETSADDARAESAANSAEAQQRAAEAEAGFVPAFEDDDEPEPQATEPAGEPTDEQGDPLDLTKE